MDYEEMIINALEPTEALTSRLCDSATPNGEVNHFLDVCLNNESTAQVVICKSIHNDGANIEIVPNVGCGRMYLLRFAIVGQYSDRAQDVHRLSFCTQYHSEMTKCIHNFMRAFSISTLLD